LLVLIGSFFAGHCIAGIEAEQKIRDAYLEGLEDGEGFIAGKPPQSNYTRVFGNLSGEYVSDTLMKNGVISSTHNSSINITVLAVKDSETGIEYFYVYIPRDSGV